MNQISFGSGRLSRLVLVSLVALLVGGLAAILVGERNERAQIARDASAQADLLATAVSGALAFGDTQAAQDYVDAVQVNRLVLAASVHDADGARVAGFARSGEREPDAVVTEDEDGFAGGKLYVNSRVTQAGQDLGVVQLVLTQRPLAQRLARYFGIVLILALAALVVLVLGFAQNALRRANIELQARATELGLANDKLQAQFVERAKAEEALRQSQKMEAIGRLTGGIAHDFNNLLMATSSGIDLLERTSDPDRRKLLSDGVRQAVERGAALTRRLLAFSRTAPLQTRVVDLRRQIEDMQILLERSLRQDIQIKLDLPGDLWPVEMDLGEFELAILNLAVNARDAMPSGGMLRITGANVVATTPEDALGDHVVLKIIDTGAGIPEHILGRIFEPFFTTKDVGKGTGLGLSQVYGFARSSGGEASVQSAPGEGTSIILCLPRSLKAVTPMADPALATAAPHAEGRILLVEDDDAVAEGVGHMLVDLGYSYVRAANGVEALRQLTRSGGFDLVFSDMVMPGGLDGLALAQAIRARLPQLPVLLTTGYSESASRVANENFHLLLKPYRMDALSEAIAKARSNV